MPQALQNAIQTYDLGEGHILVVDHVKMTIHLTEKREEGMYAIQLGEMEAYRLHAVLRANNSR